MGSWLERTDRWVAARSVVAVRLLVLLQAAGLAFFIAGTHGAFVKLAGPSTTTDFASFYVAGRLADLGRAGQGYDAAAHGRMEEAVIAPGVEEKLFLNPPVFLLLCAPLARLPYLPAFVLFEVVTFIAWLALGARVAGGGTRAVACLAAVPAVWWALGWGQNSFLSAALMAAGTLLLARRPWLAGAAFGALCFKPHFGIMLPVALLAGRQWRAMLGAALSAACLTAASAAWFGPGTWVAWLTMARHARAAVESGIALAGHADLAGAARLAGLPAGASWVLQAAAAALAAAGVAWAWSPRRATARPEAARAVLVAATLQAMPFLLFYDLVMAGVAGAWLARAAARGGGWRAGERTALALAMGASLLAFPAAALLHLALGALVAPLLLLVSLRRVA